jgi:hypothetical protein
MNVFLRPIGYWKEGKEGKKEMRSVVLAIVCYKSMIGLLSVHPAPLQPVQRFPM